MPLSPRTLTLDHQTFTVRQATAAEIAPLRHRILRAGLPFSEAHFKGDDAPTSRHAAAFDLQNEARCCATLHFEPYQGEPACRLRGMATDAGYQSLGLGSAVLTYLTDLVLSDPPTPDSQVVRLFWCNARTPAANFYLRQGWQIVSDVFDIPTAGPHYVMVRRV
jgi:GNAT superfamily N-acetyltransferase